MVTLAPRGALSTYVVGFLLCLSAAIANLAFPWQLTETGGAGWVSAAAWVCLVPLLFANAGVSAKRATLHGLIAGLLFHAGMFAWMPKGLSTMYASLDLAAACALASIPWACMSALWALASGIAKRLELSGTPLWVAVPLCWTSFDFLSNGAGYGFPWASLGTSQVQNLWLGQLASVGGRYGLTMVVVLVNASVFSLLLWLRDRKAPFPTWATAAGALVLIVGHAYGAYQTRLDIPDPASRSVSVTVVQSNLDPRLKLPEPNLFTQFAASRHAETTSNVDASPQLVVWPEAALPTAVPDWATAMPSELIGSLPPQSALLFGTAIVQTTPAGEALSNAAVLVDADRQIIGRHRKSLLVPMGEYVPLGLRRFGLKPAVGFNFTAGEAKPLKTNDPDVISIAPLICYESLFPEVARTMVHGGANVLAVLTNDSVLAMSRAGRQFMLESRMRAIENGRPLVRAARTGVSAIIDANGRVVAHTEPGLIDQSLPITVANLTPAETLSGKISLPENTTLYTRLGDGLPWALVFMTVVSALVPRLSRRQ